MSAYSRQSCTYGLPAASGGSELLVGQEEIDDQSSRIMEKGL